jgi:aconitase A
MNFIGSPELVIALALGGRLSFSPLIDELTACDGTRFKLNPPTIAGADHSLVTSCFLFFRENELGYY